MEHPPETRLGELRKEEEWDRLMAANGVYVRGPEGLRTLGVNGHRIEEYEVSRYEIEAGRMRIGSRGDVISYDATKGHLLRLPPVNLPLTEDGIEGRKAFLYSFSDRAKASRLRAIDLLAASGAELTECEKVDAEYLRKCVVKK